MAPARKLILNLDQLPESDQARMTRRPRKTSGPLTGRGGTSARAGGRKRKNLTRQSSAHGSLSLDDKEHEASRQSASPEPPIKKENEPTKRRKRDFKPVRTMTHIVGIDNGMSGSGMASAVAKTDPSQVVAEMNWPGGEGKAEKVPSVVAVQEDNPDHHDFEVEEDTFFGFEIPDDSVTRSFYKITMDQDVAASSFDDDILTKEISSKLVNTGDADKNKEAMVVAMKHLRRIHLTKIADAVGEDMVDDVEFVYVFTYPAACSPRGIDTLREAAEAAGFLDREGDKLKLISEAHAAAMAAFVGCRQQRSSQAWKTFFKKDALITIIDLGALTNDLTTIKVKCNDPKLRLEEVALSAGGKCGTAAIHCRLLDTLASKFGDAFIDIDSSMIERGTRFFKDCEKILKTFDPNRPNKKYKIAVALAEEIEHEDYDPDTEEVFLRGSEVKAAIDGTLAYAKDLLLGQWQLKKKVETTIICGGGSLIPYVFEELKAFCALHRIEAIRAKDPESTVCRGAVISELNEDFFGLRLSRASFGIEVQKDGRQYIHWFISQGDTVDTTQEIVLKKLAGYVFLGVDEVLNEAAKFEMAIYMFDRGGDNPGKINSPGVERIATIGIDATCFSSYLKGKLRRQLADKEAAMTHMDAKHGMASLGRGPLRFDATEKARDV